MSVITPLCCSPEAYCLLARQVPAIESSDALLHGAIAVSMHRGEPADADSIDVKLQEFADTIRRRIRGSQPQAVVAHLHQFLFDEMGFKGNTQDYYDPANSYLSAVLESRRGLPITLSLIYKIVAERLGLRAWGVALPGHFMAAIETEGAVMLVDPFAGGPLVTAAEARERLSEQFGPEFEWSDELLRPTSHRHWLTRMLQNLLNVFGTRNQLTDVAAILELEMLLWPERLQLQRDLGLVLARCGMTQPARVWLDRYLQANPDDPQRPQLQELLQVLGK